MLGAVPALAASSSPYDAYDQTAFLAYLNAPEAGGDLTRPPRLRVDGRKGGLVVGVIGEAASAGMAPSTTGERSRAGGTRTVMP